MASASSRAAGPCTSFGMRAPPYGFGSRIHWAIEPGFRRAPMPSKEGASMLNSGTPEAAAFSCGISRSDVLKRAHDLALLFSLLDLGRARVSELRGGDWADKEALLGPAHTHEGTALSGAVNVALRALAPFFSWTDWLRGDLLLVAATSNTTFPLISSLKWPFSSAWKKKSLRNSALAKPSQVARNLAERQRDWAVSRFNIQRDAGRSHYLRLGAVQGMKRDTQSWLEFCSAPWMDNTDHNRKSHAGRSVAWQNRQGAFPGFKLPASQTASEPSVRALMY